MKKTIVFLMLVIFCSGVLSACSDRVADTIDNVLSSVSINDSYDDNNEYIDTDNNEYNDNYYDDSGNDFTEDYDFIFDLPVNEYTYGELEEFDSKNLYRMHVPSNGLLELYFSSEKHNGQYDGTFYVHFKDEQGNNLWSGSFLGGGENVLLLRNRLEEGIYYFGVSGDDTDVVYEGFSIYPKFTDESYDSSVEKERNDTKETATKVEIGQEVRGNINTNVEDGYFDSGDFEDIDYYCFEIYEEKVLRLDMRISTSISSTNEYDMCGVFGNYDVSGLSLSTIGQEYSECYTKTVRLEPGEYYFYFALPGSVTLTESIDYYFTVSEQ